MSNPILQKSFPTLVALSMLLSGLEAVGQPFENIAPQLGISGTAGAQGPGIGGAVSLSDVTGDGELDLVFTGPGQPPLLFIRSGTGYIQMDNALIPSSPPGVANGHVTFDMDGDGDLDVLLLRTGHNAIMRNDGGGTFKDVTKGRLPGLNNWSVGAAAGDFDGDGDLDIYVANYIHRIQFPMHTCAPNSLLINDGRGHFTERSVEMGVSGRGCSLVAAMTDYDGDGDMDLMAVNDFGQFTTANELYRNDGPAAPGGWTFTEVSVDVGIDAAIYGMGVAVADINDDGHLDYYFSNIGRQALRLGTGAGTFVDATDDLGANVEFADEGYQVTWTTDFADLDNDGWLDLVVVGGHISAAAFIKNPKEQQSFLLKGLPEGGFVELGPELTLPPVAKANARDVALSDYDGDGRLDVFIGHVNGLLAIYRNLAQGALPMRVRLTPSETAPGAAGTRVTASCGPFERTFEVSAGRFYGTTTDGQMNITFPPPCNAPGQTVDLTIRWPSGYVQLMQGVTGAVASIEEPDWLTPLASSVVIDLSDPTYPLAADATVELTAEGGTVGELITTADGVWQASLDVPEGGEAVLSISVDGVLLPVHPKVRSPAFASASVRPYPAHVIVNRPYELFVVPYNDKAAPLGPGYYVEVMVGDETYLAEDMGDGSYRTPTPAATTLAAVVVQVLVDQAPHGQPTSLIVHPPVDLYHSRISFTPLHVLIDDLAHTDVTVRAALRDANATQFWAAADTIWVTMNGEVMDFALFATQGAWATFQIESKNIPDGAKLQLVADGYAVGPEVTFHHLAVPEDLATFIDPAQSRCTFNARSMYADGSDINTAFIFLRDEYGNVIEPEGLPEVVAVGIGVVPGSLFPSTERYQLEILAGMVPGVGSMSIALDGVATNVSCEIELLPPKPLVGLAEKVSTFYGNPKTLVANPGSSTDLLLIPRTPGGRMYGSGLGFETTTTIGELQNSMVYVGRGEYGQNLAANGKGGDAVVVASLVSPLFQMDTTITFLGNAPPEPDPEPDDAEDAGSMEDAGSDEAEPGDMAEPVDDEDVFEPPPDAGDPADAGTIPDAGELADSPVMMEDVPAAADNGPTLVDTEVANPEPAMDDAGSLEDVLIEDVSVASDTSTQPDAQDQGDVGATGAPDAGDEPMPDAPDGNNIGGADHTPSSDLQDLAVASTGGGNEDDGGCQAGSSGPLSGAALILAALGLLILLRRGRICDDATTGRTACRARRSRSKWTSRPPSCTDSSPTSRPTRPF